MKQKYPYLKQILKTVAKTALLAGATLILTPYTFGFAAGLTNTLIAGYVAGTATLGIGAFKTIKTFVNDVATMGARVKAQQREDYIDSRFEKIENGLNNLRSHEQAYAFQPVQTNDQGRFIGRHDDIRSMVKSANEHSRV